MSKDKLLEEFKQIQKTSGSKINDNPHNKKIRKFIEMGKSRFSLGDLKQEIESLKSDINQTPIIKQKVENSETYKEDNKRKISTIVCPYKQCAKSDACAILEITGKIPKSMESCSYSLTRDQQTKKDNKVFKQKEHVKKK